MSASGSHSTIPQVRVWYISGASFSQPSGDCCSRGDSQDLRSAVILAACPQSEIQKGEKPAMRKIPGFVLRYVSCLPCRRWRWMIWARAQPLTGGSSMPSAAPRAPTQAPKRAPRNASGRREVVVVTDGDSKVLAVDNQDARERTRWPSCRRDRDRDERFHSREQRQDDVGGRDV